MQLSEKSVRRLVKRGDLAAYKLGTRGQLRSKRIDLERYLEAQRVEVDGCAGPNVDSTEPGK